MYFKKFVSISNIYLIISKENVSLFPSQQLFEHKRECLKNLILYSRKYIYNVRERKEEKEENQHTLSLKSRDALLHTSAFLIHVLYVYSDRRGAKSRRDERKRRRTWGGKRRESRRRRREESEELKISHPVVYTERPAASTCRTGCYLPPCYSRARAKLINGKVEALNAPRIYLHVPSPRGSSQGKKYLPLFNSSRV